MVKLKIGPIKLEIITILFCALQIVNLFGYISQANEDEGLFSLISQGYIIICILCFLVSLSYKMNYKNAKLLFCVIGMAASAYLSHLVTPGMGTYSLLIVLFGYLSLPLYFISMEYVPQRRGVYKAVTLGAISTTITFFVMYLIDPQYVEKTDALTLGFSNPNRLAIYLVSCISVLVAVYDIYKNKRIQRLIMVSALISTYLLYLTQCRTAYLAMIITWFFFLKRKKWLIKKWVVTAFLFLPVIYVFLLLYLVNSGAINSDMTLWDKPLLSGREKLFFYALSNIKGESIIFGKLSEYQFGNAHNSFMSIYCTVGVVGLVMFYLFYFNACFALQKKANENAVRKLAFIGVLMLFISGCAEAATLVSGAMYASASAALLYLTCYEENES